MTSSRSPDFTIPTSFPNLFLSPDGETASGSETPPVNKTGGGDSGGEDEGIDPDTVVEVDGEPVKIGTLVEARRAAKNAEAVRAAARTLANARASDDDRRAAARVVALADGVKEDELESAIDQMLGEDDPEDEDDPVPTPKPRRKPKARREGKEQPVEDDRTAKELADLRKELLEDKTKRLGNRIKEAAVNALHSIDGIEGFVAQMQKPRQVAGKDGRRRSETEDEVSARVQKWYDRSVQSIIQNSTRAMTERRSREGRFDESWIDDATSAVAADEFEHLKSAVGEANLIGRSTETESEVSALLSSAPPPKPAYKPGMSVAELQEAAKASFADAAARDAADSLKGGSTVA